MTHSCLVIDALATFCDELAIGLHISLYIHGEIKISWIAKYLTYLLEVISEFVKILVIWKQSMCL